MDKRQTFRLLGPAGLAVAAALAAGGCESYRYSEKMLNGPGQRAIGPAQGDVTPELTNSARLKSLPAPVQTAFNDEYGGATVTRVGMEPTGTGAMFYRIVFIENGRAGQAVYRSDGRPAPGQAQDTGVIVRQDEEFVPIRRTTPTTLPAGTNIQ